MSFEYCPGCSHSRFQHLLAEVIAKNQWQKRARGVSSLGCSQGMGEHFSFPVVQAPPGLAAAVATGIKRTSPDKLVFTYQGDGDLANQGWNAFMHAVLRGDNLTVFCLNNFVMAGSGGQMSPTSLTGQMTTTTRFGRSSSRAGKPLDLAKMIANLPNIAYCARLDVSTPKDVAIARQLVQKAFENQEKGKGVSFIEVLGICPPYWHQTPLQAQEKLVQMAQVYPPGTYQETLK